MLKLPAIGPGPLSAAVALFIVLVLNGTLWSQTYQLIGPRSAGDWLFLASFLVFQLATYLFFLRALAMPFVLKIVVAVMIVIGAAAAHFMAEYGTVIDSNMIRNVLQSDAAEARDLVTPAAVLRVFGFGVLPAALMLMIPVQWPAWKTLLRRNAQMCLAALVVVGGNFAAFSGAYFSVLRENSEIALTSTPANVVIAGGKLAIHTMRAYSGPITPIGTDARIAPAGERARPLVTILVIGETARAENFSLFGYGRDTNPGLRKTPDIVAFPQVTSCGTDTGVSVPCIFSGLGRSNYSLKAFKRRENMLDLVQRTGLDVLWIDNQGGCKGVCARVPTLTVTSSKDARYCGDGECHDEILLDKLDERIAAMRNGGVIVLHMMGSHGPAYYKRVPESFARFQPVCETSQFSKCTREQIVNSYDNTIAYTDHVLSELISLLRRTSAGRAGHDDALRVRSRRVAGGERALPARDALCPRARTAEARPHGDVAVAGRARLPRRAEGLHRRSRPQGAVLARQRLSHGARPASHRDFDLRREPRYPAAVPRSPGDMGLQPRDFGKRRKVIGSPLKPASRAGWPGEAS